MKKIICLALMLIMTVSIGITAFAAEQNTLTVTGSYTITAVADEAYINVGVRTNNVDYKLCQEENKTKMNEVMAAIREIGIEDRYIKTTSYNSNPVYEYVSDGMYNSKRVFKEYEIIHSISVTLTDLDLVGRIIDVTVEKGVNELNNVQFAITKPRQHELYLKALEGASGRAKDKADVLAKSFGINNLSIKTINVDNYSVARPYMNYASNYSASYGGGASYDDAGNYTNISSGEMEVTASVTVVYTY